MRLLSVWVLLVVGAVFTLAQSDESAAPTRTYNILRENENWSFLKDPSLRDDFWDPIKYISLWDQASYLLQRYMLHSDWHLGEHFRVFVQLKSGIESFREGGPRPIDAKNLDFEAAYFEAATSGRNWIALRVGRQELNYGSGRLVSVREGPNVRQSFDGAKIRSHMGAWNIDGFAARPRPGKLSFDSYYLGLDRKQAVYNCGAAQELRHSLGARLWRPVQTKEQGWDLDYEGVWQFGTFGGDQIRAWTFATETGYSLPNLPLKSRFSVKSDISSGDGGRPGTLGTFNPVYPVGNYFGVIADTGPGPVNFIDIHPRLQTQLPNGVTASIDLVAQWRENVNDGVYAVPGFLLVAAADSRARFVGYRPGVEVRWQIDRHAYLQADYGVFYAGQFLKEASPGQNLDYMAFWAGYKF